MGVVSFPSVASGLSTEELANLVARLIKEVEWTVNGNMDSANIRNISGFNVGPNQLKHSSGIVGMDGSNPTVATAVRFWSGDADPTIAPFRVTQSGILTAVGALFQSAAGYPRVEINSTNNLIAAYSDVNNYVAIIPNLNAVPSVVMVDTGVTKAFIRRVAGSGLQIGSFGTEPINLQPSGPLQINGTSGWSGTINYVKNVVSGSPTFGAITVNNGIITNAT